MERTRAMCADQYACFEELEQALAGAGIQRCRPGALSDRQVRMVQQVFETEISSVLSPLAVDYARAIPTAGQPDVDRGDPVGKTRPAIAW